MKIENQVIVDITDKGGIFDVSKQHSKFVYEDVTYTYIATGFVREVFRSECGKFVIKIPKTRYRFDHNILEYEVYRDAPEWCKDYIAKTELTKDNYVIQEYVKVNPDAGNFYREIGTRESDGKLVIFDCDIFLNHKLQKPETGFRYQQVFCKSNAFGEASVKAKSLPRELRLKQKENIKKYFPDFDNQSFMQKNDEVFIDGKLVPENIADECGFTYKSHLDYE